MDNKNTTTMTTTTTTTVVSQPKTDIVFSIGDETEDAPSDITPHQLFCEMDELQYNSNDSHTEWKEAARWVKFEEDVELGGRWSKPHVATLSLHSLFELRSYIYTGVVILDSQSDSLDKIADEIISHFIHKNQLDSNHSEQLKSILTARHVHQHEKEFRKQIDNGEKKTFPLIKSLADMGKKMSHRDMRELDSNQHSKRGLNKLHSATATVLSAQLSHSPGNMGTSTNFLSASNASATSLKDGQGPIFELGSSSMRVNEQRDDQPRNKANAHFMKKIPRGAEAANILIGEADFVDRPLNALVRLSKSILLRDVTEVAVPTRFLFLLLGPKGSLTKYHEIGRSMATLMSDDIFHDVAYKAKSTEDLVQGVDDFLDQVTVLPPGEWHPNIRLDPPAKVLEKEERLELQAETKHINGNGATNGNTHQSNGNHKVVQFTCHSDEDPCLQRTGRLCGGLIDDIKRKAPWYWSDFKDALSFKCISTILFLYFACLSPIITFGGLLGVATDKNMAAIESLLSGAVCGTMYHMFSGQPMTIVGSTGPVLVFETIVNRFSKDHGIDYMGFRAWIGLWTMLILIIIVVTDASVLVKYITRFTEESFAVLIAFIFIRESVSKLLEIQDQKSYSTNLVNYETIVQNAIKNKSCYICQRKANNVNDFNTTLSNDTDFGYKTSFYNITMNESVNEYYKNYNEIDCKKLGPEFDYVSTCKYVPDVFFFSVVLYMITFLLALGLKNFKFTRFFPQLIRSKLSDFCVVITVFVSVGLDYFLGLDTPKLNVPSNFQTTIPNRGWFINPITRNKDKFWVAFAAIIPALLATILIFMDQHITAVIINRKENKLKKGGGYHLDLLIIAVCIGINSLLGIPWFVAATVLSINHILSLKIESESAAPGEKPKFLGVIEQRVTGTVVFILIGCSVFMTRLLSLIPMPVLYAIFLYMGISSLREIQFMHRLVLLFMPEKYQPDYLYLRHVRTPKVHIFTIIQITCLTLLFVIKMNKTISIVFPLMVLALVFIRKLMDYVFSTKELYYLDDLMPEITKKRKEDGEEDENENFSTDSVERQYLQEMNISNELSKTSIWKHIVSDKKKEFKDKKRKDANKLRSKSLPQKDKDIEEEVDLPLMDNKTTTTTKPRGNNNDKNKNEKNV